MSPGAILMSLRCRVLKKQLFHHKPVGLLIASSRDEPFPCLDMGSM